MGKMSREKGKRFEREVAAAFREYGYDAHRSAQFKGNTGQAADVEGVPGLHIEAKRQEQFRIYDWIAQADRDADAGAETGRRDLPAVIFRKSDSPMLVTMHFEDWIQLYREWEAGRGGEHG